MAGAIRPSAKLAKLAYSILKTPKELQQHNEPRPAEWRRLAWAKNSMLSQ